MCPFNSLGKYCQIMCSSAADLYSRSLHLVHYTFLAGPLRCHSICLRYSQAWQPFIRPRKFHSSRFPQMKKPTTLLFGHLSKILERRSFQSTKWCRMPQNSNFNQNGNPKIITSDISRHRHLKSVMDVKFTRRYLFSRRYNNYKV
jgi:hypothetical protein